MGREDGKYGFGFGRGIGPPDFRPYAERFPPPRPIDRGSDELHALIDAELLLVKHKDQSYGLISDVGKWRLDRTIDALRSKLEKLVWQKPLPKVDKSLSGGPENFIPVGKDVSLDQPDGVAA